MASRKVKADTFEDVEKLIQLYAEQDRLRHSPLQQGEVSQKTYGLMCGCSPDKAARILEEYVAQGLWTKREATINGKKGVAYRPKTKPKGKK